MTEDPSHCCGSTEPATTETETSGGRWISDGAVLDAELPSAVRSTLGRFIGAESVDTLGEWAGAIRQQTGGGPISEDDLCFTNEERSHWGTVDGERHYFACFYDAVILAAISERPVDIHTESPDGTVIEARAVGEDELTVEPSGAVFSLGIDETVDAPPEGGPTLEESYAAICPYVKAFPDASAYEEWATTVPAATVAMELDGATEFAAALVGDPPQQLH